MTPSTGGPDSIRRKGPYFIRRQQGCPWENGYGEAFIGRVRDAQLDRELFTSILEAQVVLGDWLVDYNTERPHGALRQQTPSEFAARFAAAGSASLPPPQQSESNAKALT